jgi:Tfp pilus assembly protein PilV
MRGFTILEALVSLILLSVGLIALAQIHVRLFAASGLAKAQTIAVNLTQQKLEDLRLIDYERMTGDTDVPASQLGDNASYVRRWVVTAHGAPDYKEVSITTTWQTPEGQSRSVTLTSFIARSTPARLNPIGTDGSLNEDERADERAR